MQINIWWILAWIATSLISQFLMAQRGRTRGAHIRSGIMQGLGLAILLYLWVNPPPAAAP
jgi:hypothetical protein